MNNSINNPSVEPTMIQGKIQWIEPEMKQNLSLPSSVIYYIAMNPSNPEFYKKLIQCCKYFFEANPILVAANMAEESICSNHKWFGNGKCCIKIDIKKIKSKIWLTRRLDLHQKTIPNFAELLRPKIYRCDIVKLLILYGTVNFDDLKALTTSAKDVTLLWTEIICNNGIPVMLENILETIPPNVEKFCCRFANNTSMISASTVKNISKLKSLRKLKNLDCYNLPEAFQIDDILTLIKDHNGIKFWLAFAPDISEQCKNKLDHIIDSLIESKLSNCYISYRGRNEKKGDILWKIFSK